MRRLILTTCAAILLLGALALPALAQTYIDDFEVEKVVTGDDAPDGVEDVTWSFELSCTILDGDDTRPVTFDADGTTLLEFDLGPDDTLSVDTVPPDAVCTIAETGIADDAGLGIAFEPAFVSVTVGGETTLGPSRTFIAEGAAVGVTFTNDFGDTPVEDTAELEIGKEVIGPDSGAAFEITADCDTQDPVVASLSGGASIAFPVVLDDTTGARCEVTETETRGADAVSYALDGTTVPAAPPLVVEFSPPDADPEVVETRVVAVANTFDEEEVLGTARLDLLKTVVGDGAEAFGFTVACSEQDPVDLTVGVGSAESVSLPVTLDESTGATCTVTETDPAGATAVAFLVDGTRTEGTSTTVAFDPPADDEQEQTILVEARNTYERGVPPVTPPPATPTPTTVVDDTGVLGTGLAFTGFPLTWGVLLALGLLLPGGGALYAARRRRSL